MTSGNLNVCAVCQSKSLPETTGTVYLADEVGNMPHSVDRWLTCQSQSGVSLGLHLGSKMKFSVLPQKQLHMKEYNTINSVWNPNFAKLSLIFIEIQQLEKPQSDETFLCWGCYTMLIWYTFYWVLLMMFSIELINIDFSTYLCMYQNPYW